MDVKVTQDNNFGPWVSSQQVFNPGVNMVEIVGGLTCLGSVKAADEDDFAAK